MVLSEEDKKKIKDFMMHKSDVDPTKLMSSQDRVEAFEYASFVVHQRILKSVSKVCNKIW